MRSTAGRNASRRWSDPTTAQLAAVTAVWVILTVAFEFSFGHYVDGKTWSELIANYSVLRGRLWPFVLATIAAAPFIGIRSY